FGDQTGSSPETPSERTLLPSAEAISMSLVPTAETKVRRDPSGDQDGERPAAMRTRFLPSVPTTERIAEERPATQASLLPSGESTGGSWSCPTTSSERPAPVAVTAAS